MDRRAWEITIAQHFKIVPSIRQCHVLFVALFIGNIDVEVERVIMSIERADLPFPVNRTDLMRNTGNCVLLNCVLLKNKINREEFLLDFSI